ncbi:MAG: transposase [Bryobacteraceae bacterium]|jgi:putative transposase
MPRSKRVVAVGAAHHVTQRGNSRQDVFVNDGVRRAYLDLLAEHAGRNKLRVVAYCLMTNHVHLVVVPESERSLANTFRHAHGRFSQYWNTAFHRTGHLWQNRFYSCPVEEAAEWRVIRYVEQNPVRAGMVERAAEYGWSSARAHAGMEASAMLDCEWWERRCIAKSWQAVLEESGEEAAAIRLATYSGRPYGSAMFVRALETQLGRRLERRKGGRPPKRPEESAQMAFRDAEQ